MSCRVGCVILMMFALMLDIAQFKKTDSFEHAILEILKIAFVIVAYEMLSECM